MEWLFVSKRRADQHRETSQSQALAYLGVVVLLLGSISPVMKYLLTQTPLSPVGLTFSRVTIALVILMMVALLTEQNPFRAILREDLALLGLLGVWGIAAAYLVAAWGLLYTPVSHYVLIYSVMPCMTLLFSRLAGRETITGRKVLGCIISCLGCLLSIKDSFAPFRQAILGDALILLFTILLAGHLVMSAGVVARYGAITANTIMFGSAVAALSPTALTTAWVPQSLTGTTVTLMLYLGVATGLVYVCRYLALQVLTPAFVGAFHDLVPVCSIWLAAVWLAEPVHAETVAAALMILAGLAVLRNP